MPTLLLLLIMILSMALAFFACEEKKKPEAEQAVTEATPLTYERQTYKTVIIGKQTWMAENLNYAAEGSKCYDNEEENCLKYGRLYDWATAMKVCPTGWHLPSYAEWEVLSNSVGGSKTEGKHLKAKIGWRDNKGKSSGNGLDTYGFAALPGGYGSSGGDFGSVGSSGYWWSTTSDIGSYGAYGRYMHCSSEIASWYLSNESGLFSLRCLQD